MRVVELRNNGLKMAAWRCGQLLLHRLKGAQRFGWCEACRLHFRMVSGTVNSEGGENHDDSGSSGSHVYRDNSSTGDETFSGPVPREKLTVSFSRSSGPGGQNVNKLSTKAEVRFHVNSADWIPDRVKHRVLNMYKNRITKRGELVITSQRYRTQHKNLDDAVLKLDGILREASEVPRGPSELTVARIKALKRRADRQRRTEKKYLSEKKLHRKTFPID